MIFNNVMSVFCIFPLGHNLQTDIPYFRVINGTGLYKLHPQVSVRVVYTK
jgi:hypothetical protein